MGSHRASPPPTSEEKKDERPRDLSRDATTTTTTHSNRLSLRDVNPVETQVRDLAVAVDLSPSTLSIAQYLPRTRRRDGSEPPQTKQILHSVSASMPAGTVTAIIGGSGSGKTTMLNTMAERMNSSRLALGGHTIFNGLRGVKSIRSAYVMQQDVLLPSLTVRETLQYSTPQICDFPGLPQQRRGRRWWTGSYWSWD